MAPLVIYLTKEAKGNVDRPLLYFKFSTSINITDDIWSIMNTQAINICQQQVIGRPEMFTFKAFQKYILTHVHGQCNILCGGALFFWLFLYCLVFASSFKSSPWNICKCYERTCHFDFLYCVFCTPNLTSVMKSGSFTSP